VKKFGQNLDDLQSKVSSPRKMSTLPLLKEELLKNQHLAGTTDKKTGFSYTLKDYFNNAVPSRNTGMTNAQRSKPQKSLQKTELQTPRLPQGNSEIEEAIKQASLKHNVPENMIRSVIKAESNFNPRAVSPVGARGLMQLMPGTARELGVKDSFNVGQNIEGGTKYLRQMLDKFGDERKAIAAYNAGPGAVQKHGGIPPYRETQAYVKKVMQNLKGQV
jgi:soluble lytic murein transglycosylase-like protein